MFDIYFLSTLIILSVLRKKYLYVHTVHTFLKRVFQLGLLSTRVCIWKNKIMKHKCVWRLKDFS